MATKISHELKWYNKKSLLFQNNSFKYFQASYHQSMILLDALD